MTGCSNIIRAGLINSSTVFLDPSMNRTAYLQLRNISENQNVTLSGVQSKLTAKATEGVTPESVTKANFGAGISSGSAAMASANSIGWRPHRENDAGRYAAWGHDGMGTMPTGGEMPDMKAMSDQVRTMGWALAMSDGHGGFPGMQMQQAQKEDGVTYLCVTDVQITDRKMGKPLGQPTSG